MIEKSKCRSCGATILWAATESGKKIPLDACPSENGNVVLIMGPRVGEAKAHVETKAETETRMKFSIPAERKAYVSHFATCSASGKWRRKESGK